MKYPVFILYSTLPWSQMFFPTLLVLLLPQEQSRP